MLLWRLLANLASIGCCITFPAEKSMKGNKSFMEKDVKVRDACLME